MAMPIIEMGDNDVKIKNLRVRYSNAWQASGNPFFLLLGSLPWAKTV
jgi:hypothetical protein